ncbi:hypothetical protein UFOVP1414_67 [uncultured Caudovirales phage]|uniref:Bacteriophage P22, Gp10, DNA-stabilising n=1 Tax=uncultured Caudovirales phage TaxID=2100421 RepID=A0A6J5M861_9CAUD|nr:hypothetical protein UFOVP442_10 [uncultured Caudovirales phage]CAB4211971.1 hypothetical protein UFOVP1414_67 [uncultured Caudovirales phage]
MKIPLKGGAYTARSLIANAQRCVNLFPERNPEDAASEFTHYTTPGLTTLATAPNSAPVRGLYTASNGKLFAVVGNKVYYVNGSWAMTEIGTLAIPNGTTPVKMRDNSAIMVIVDGSIYGYTVDLNSNAFAQISNPAFYGATNVAYLDTFLLFNRPNTKQFYTTESDTLIFNPLYYAQKTAAPDVLRTVMVKHRELWLLGEKTSEVWYNAGNQNFPFQSLPGTFVEHGICAPYSAAIDGVSLIWLTRNDRGQAVAVRTEGYDPTKISTYALEAEWSTYAQVDDAIGYTYQSGGHTFYVLTFPTANKTWVYDGTENLWHERAWMDNNGFLHRHRSNCYTFAYNKHVVGDFQNGRLYEMADQVYTDAGDAILRLRSFPHLGSEAKRIVYNQFIADMEVGTAGVGLTPVVALKWSDTRGQTFGAPVQQSVGTTGQFLTSIQWRRLGTARDRVFELSWSQPYRTALNGAYIDFTVCAT